MLNWMKILNPDGWMVDLLWGHVGLYWLHLVSLSLKNRNVFDCLVLDLGLV